MTRLLLATDLDRTLIPNGPEPESSDARPRFAALAVRDEVALAYVSGRHRALVERAIANYALPAPQHVVADVGTTIYGVTPAGAWVADDGWDAELGRDWDGGSVGAIRTLLGRVRSLRPQGPSRQGRYKVSYFVPLHVDPDALLAEVRALLDTRGVRARLVWSVDTPAGVGLLDVLPERASKLHALRFLMQAHGYGETETVFAGDSGNDLEALASPIPAVLVANGQPRVREEATRLSAAGGHPDRLYCATGGFLGMNGNYGAGILEGIAHFHPCIVEWFGDRAPVP